MSTIASNAVHDRLPIEVAPVEQVFYWGSRIVIAQFSCRPDHPHFFGTGPIRTPVFGFPRKSSSLAVNDEKPFLADPTVAVLLNRGDHYRRSVVSQEDLLSKTYGRIREVEQGPDGFIYFSTSSRDGRGRPASDDERIMRLVLAGDKKPPANNANERE